MLTVLYEKYCIVFGFSHAKFCVCVCVCCIRCTACCMRCIGVSRADQRIRHLTSERIRAMFGMETSMKDLLSIRRLRWLGHTARMDDVRIPKRLLFGWLPRSRPAHGVKLRWRDKVRQDLKRFCIAEAGWYCLAQDRTIWRDLCQQGLKKVQNAASSNVCM